MITSSRLATVPGLRNMRMSAKILLTASALASAIALVPGLVPPAMAAGKAKVSASSASQNINLGLNKSLVIDLPADAYDVLVANPAVADAVTRTARRIYLFGKQVGQTNVFVFGPNGEQIASLDISVERDVAGLEAHLARFIENSDIKAEIINDNIVLTGTVQTPLDATRAVKLAEVFVTGGEATTGNFATTASGASGGGDVAISNPDDERRSSQIVNLIQIIGQDQVTLKVTVAEIHRHVMKQLGVNVVANQLRGDGIFGYTIHNTLLSGLGKPLVDGYTGGVTAAVGSATIDSYFNAMEAAGVMKTLAEPSLTAISGEQATFQVGGEFNQVVESSTKTNDNGSQSIEYKVQKVEYGIGLEFLPVVLSPGRISLKIRTTVSEPTTEGSVNMPLPSAMPGVNLISIRKRLADTTVELPSGGSMMIAGLVRDDIRQAINGLPGLKDVPVLGTLFRSRDFERNETELVILVTPYLVRPVARNKLAKPDDNFNAASDGAGNFLSRVNRVYGTMKTDKPNGRYHGVVGYIYK